MKYSIEEIRSRIHMHGLGAELIETSFKQIEDPVLATLWEDTQALIDEIQIYLDEDHVENTTYDDEDEE